MIHLLFFLSEYTKKERGQDTHINRENLYARNLFHFLSPNIFSECSQLMKNEYLLGLSECLIIIVCYKHTHTHLPDINIYQQVSACRDRTHIESRVCLQGTCFIFSECSQLMKNEYLLGLC